MNLSLPVDLSWIDWDDTGYLRLAVPEIIVHYLQFGKDSVDEDFINVYHEQICEDFDDDSATADDIQNRLLDIRKKLVDGITTPELSDHIMNLSPNGCIAEVFYDQGSHFLFKVKPECT